MPYCLRTRQSGRSVLLPLTTLAGTVVLSVSLAVVVPVSAGAQSTTVRGTVKNSAGIPMEGAQVTIAGGPATAMSNDRGVFTISATGSGPFLLRVRRLGFRPDSMTVPPEPGKTVELGVVLQRAVVELVPVTVIGRRELTGHMAGFYKRRTSSSGRFFTEADIARRNTNRMSDLLRQVPGLRVVPRGLQYSVRVRGSRCAPMVWLDGVSLSAMEFDLDAMDPSVYEGIEVYSGPASVPVEFQGNRAASSSCGTIILWTRRGTTSGRKLVTRDAAAAQKVAALVARHVVFLESQVDSKARLDSTAIVRPVYPDEMFDAGTPGFVLAEFVVNTAGEVMLETFNVVLTSDRAFVEPVRRAVKDQRFVPAMRGGTAVQQVVQQPFSFVPDSTARRKR